MGKVVRRGALLAGVCGALGLSGALPAVSTSAASTSLTNVSIDAAFFGPVDVPLYLAAADGYFKKEGLSVSFITASSNTQLAAVIGGSVQFASTDPVNTIDEAANGGPTFYNFMAVEIGYSEDLVMSKTAFAAAGLTSSSPLQSEIAALANKPLGVISASGENGIIFKYLFHWAGIPSSELNMVQLGSPPAILAALQQGSVVAANLGSPYPADAVAAGYAEYLMRAPLVQAAPMGTAVTQTLATTESYYNHHRGIINRFLTAYKMGLATEEKSPTATAKYVYHRYLSSSGSLASFMSSFDEDKGIIAANTTITSAEMSAWAKVVEGAGITLPSNWKSYFVTP